MKSPGLRLDRWLWHARFVRQRSLVAELVQRRRIRLNGQLVSKVHQLVRPNDVLTVVGKVDVIVVRVLDLGTRRGPAREAQGLYERLSGDGAGPATGPTSDTR